MIIKYIVFYSTSLKWSNVIRDVGVTFDSKLTLKDYIEFIVSSEFTSLGFVFCSGRSLNDIETLKFLCNTYV